MSLLDSGEQRCIKAIIIIICLCLHAVFSVEGVVLCWSGLGSGKQAHRQPNSASLRAEQEYCRDFSLGQVCHLILLSFISFSS